MRNDILLTILAVLALSEGAAPGARAAAEAPTLPAFSSAETLRIARDDDLSRLLARDPWLVRRLLDWSAVPASASAPGPAGPALDMRPRDASGSVEWIALLKRARAHKRVRVPQGPDARSSEGSLELIDMMKKARAKKAGGS